MFREFSYKYRFQPSPHHFMNKKKYWTCYSIYIPTHCTQWQCNHVISTWWASDNNIQDHKCIFFSFGLIPTAFFDFLGHFFGTSLCLNLMGPQWMLWVELEMLFWSPCLQIMVIWVAIVLLFVHYQGVSDTWCFLVCHTILCQI